MKRLLGFPILVLSMISLGALHTSAAELTKVSLILNFSPYGLHVGPAVAKEQGLYSAAGLDVEIIRGQGSGESVKRVALGATTFGLADATAVAFGRERGLGVRQVATILDESGYVVYYRKNSGIRAPKDLEGKTLGASVEQSVFKLFPVYAKATGFDSSKVNFIIMNLPSVIPSFISGKIDSMVTLLPDEPSIVAATAKAQVEWDKFLYKSSGIDTYSVGIVASDDRIRAEPELVKKFVNATMEGYAVALDSPEMAADSFVKLYPENNRDLVLSQWNAAKGLLWTETAKQKGLGYIAQARMEKTLELLKTFAQVDSVKASDLYTMDLLDPHFPKK